MLKAVTNTDVGLEIFLLKKASLLREKVLLDKKFCEFNFGLTHGFNV